jgi:hypothetical protein
VLLKQAGLNKESRDGAIRLARRGGHEAVIQSLCEGQDPIDERD